MAVTGVYFKLEGTALEKAYELDYPESFFKEKFIDFIRDFDGLLFTHIKWLPTKYSFFGGFEDVNKFEMVDETHFELIFYNYYDEAISFSLAEEEKEQVQDYIKKLNVIFELFGIDIKFKEKIEVEYNEIEMDWEEDEEEVDEEET